MFFYLGMFNGYFLSHAKHAYKTAINFMLQFTNLPKHFMHNMIFILVGS